MVPIILALVIGATITVPITGWILSLNQNIGETNAKLEASTVSTEEWNRLGHMSLDELRAQKETLKEPYPVGDYKVMVNLGEEGYFSDGKCGAVPSGRVANCFDNTTITVFNSDGDRQFNSRQMPLQVGIYTKEEIDGLLGDLKQTIASDYYKKTEVDKKIQDSGGITYQRDKGNVFRYNCKISHIREERQSVSGGGGSSGYTNVYYYMTLSCPSGTILMPFQGTGWH